MSTSDKIEYNETMNESLSFKGNDPGAVQFGNFINYYQFHPPKTRIDSLPSDEIWNCIDNSTEQCVALDIGCNSGDLTIDLYTFLCNNCNSKNVSVLGIDIDPTLITRANEIQKKNVSFQCLDIMTESVQSKLEKYLSNFNKRRFDVIFCFSVTMWIHLNSGDDGLKRFLHLLCKNGKLLVIEPQPWKCYRTAVRRMKKSNESFPLYPKLEIRQNVESEIENIVLGTNLFDKVHETVSSEWSRKLYFFRCKDV